MVGRAWFLIAICLLISACSPEVSGPVPARPVTQQSAVATTTTPPATSTTIAEVASGTAQASPGCPTDFCVRYRIDADARWSDGSAITAADFIHTAVRYREAYPDAPPYDAVSDVVEIDERTVLAVFEGPYGGWQSLFERILQDGDQGTSIDGLATTGPFQFDEWAEGEFLTLERNPDWWAGQDPLSGDPLGEVERIRFVFIDSPEEMVDALENGTVHVISVRPDISVLASLSEIDDIDFVLEPGPFWEHIDFHHEDPVLAQPWMREVFSLAIDREKVLDRTVRRLDPDASGIDNTVWMKASDHYEAHFVDEFDPGRASQILEDHGCSPGEDDVQVCGGERMSFRWVSTTDDPARREIFESVREDMESVGIEVVGEFLAPSDFIRRDFLFGGPDRWQLINFSWRGRTDPIGANSIYYCGEAGTLNVNRYCSDRVQRLIRSTESLTQPDGRAAVYNRADRLYLEDRALIPLYQKPVLMAWTSDVSGPEPNHTISGDLWNVAAWTGPPEVVVAVPSEPAAIDPLSVEDDVINTILGPLLYGASGMDPSYRRLPVLVESIEPITPYQR